MLRRTVEAFRAFIPPAYSGGDRPGQQELAAAALAGLTCPRPSSAARLARNRCGWVWKRWPRLPRLMCLIHDAARPLISPSVIGAWSRRWQAGADGALPMVAASDTLRRRDARWALELGAADNLYRAQTPQGFVYDKILARPSRSRP
jgi:2-C-methyl-D-erythritol 4-phosphate cytidylyltransferase/2-C-methyl-D-erythritol 2,4-cyclodiphosphate synthase